MKTAPLLTVVSSLLFAGVCSASNTHDIDHGIESSLRATLNDHHVHVHVHHGIVTLDGRVRTAAERDRIESLIRNTTGVVGLKDEMKVTSPSPGRFPEYPTGVPVYTTPAPVVVPTAPVIAAPAPVVIPEYPKVRVQAGSAEDEPIANRIVTQLRADAVPTADLGNVRIMVSNGNVSLTGEVSSPSAHDALIASLQHAGGAKAIYDQLVVH